MERQTLSVGVSIRPRTHCGVHTREEEEEEEEEAEEEEEEEESAGEHKNIPRHQKK